MPEALVQEQEKEKVWKELDLNPFPAIQAQKLSFMSILVAR